MITLHDARARRSALDSALDSAPPWTRTGSGALLTLPTVLLALTAAMLPAALLPAGLRAQPPAPVLRLEEVVASASADGAAARAARADAKAAHADVTATSAGFLPQLRLEAGAARTNDPIGVFGTRLRQRVVTAADFDPATLNRPDALSAATGAAVLEQPILAPQALLGRRAAVLAARAGDAMAESHTRHAQLDAARAYYGARLARASLVTLDSALVAARAHVRQAQTLERNGVVTRADVLLAEVRLGELEAQRSTAQGQTVIARLALAVHMGAAGDTSRALPTNLPASAALQELAAAVTSARREPRARQDANEGPSSQVRPDVQAARLGAEAAAADVRRANARWLPTVGAMVRTDWASPDRPFGGTPFWSAGLMVTVPVFSGGGEFADRERAHARAQAASARAAGAEDQAELEVTRYAVERDVALQRLRLADRALAQSTEALRLVQRRYDGGLAAITELLDAAAARSAADLAAVSARHDVLVAVAAERVARGLDLSPLYALDR